MVEWENTANGEAEAWSREEDSVSLSEILLETFRSGFQKSCLRALFLFRISGNVIRKFLG